MRIWMATTSPAATFYLAEDPSVTLRACACNEFKITPKHETEVRPLFRGASPAFFDRLNLQHSISFQVRRLWATSDIASAYILDHGATIIWGGTLNWISTLGSVQRKSLGAVIQDAPCHQVGCTTFHSYSILCGQIVTGP